MPVADPADDLILRASKSLRHRRAVPILCHEAPKFVDDNMSDALKKCRPVVRRPGFDSVWLEHRTSLEDVGHALFTDEFCLTGPGADGVVMSSRWRLTGVRFARAHHDGAITVSPHFHMYFDERGKLMGTRASTTSNAAFTLSAAASVIPTVVLAWMACRNIEVLREGVAARASRGERCSANSVRWSTLVVKRGKVRYRMDGHQVDHGEPIQGLHMRQGHFADFTRGKGLFGKYHVEVWVPPHWRGDARRGIINREAYDVRQPEEDAA